MTNLHILINVRRHSLRSNRTGCNGRSKSYQRFALSLSARSDCRFRSLYVDASEDVRSERLRFHSTAEFDTTGRSPLSFKATSQDEYSADTTGKIAYS